MAWIAARAHLGRFWPASPGKNSVLPVFGYLQHREGAKAKGRKRGRRVWVFEAQRPKVAGSDPLGSVSSRMSFFYSVGFNNCPCKVLLALLPG